MKKLEKMNDAEVQKIIDKKEEQLQASHTNGFPQSKAANIYDNSALFKRETIEAKMEKNPLLSANGPSEVP